MGEIGLNSANLILCTGAIIAILAAFLFDPHLWGSIDMVMVGAGVATIGAVMRIRVEKNKLGMAALILCVLCVVILGTRVTKQYAIEEALGCFQFENRTVLSARFLITRPTGEMVRPVWMIKIRGHGEYGFISGGVVWVGPWSGEIIDINPYL